MTLPRPRPRGAAPLEPLPAEPQEAGGGETTLRAELAVAREQQEATAEILRIISGAPSDLQTVFDAVCASIVRLCESQAAAVHVVVEGGLQRAANQRGFTEVEQTRPLDPGWAAARAVLERRVVHLHDLQGAEGRDYPVSRAISAAARTLLLVPMIRNGEPVGALGTHRTIVRPFSEQEIKLLQTFAGQVVVAIENARLFAELQERNRELAEALERQTATGQVLEVISRTTSDVRPVFETVVEHAIRLCGADAGLLYRLHGDVYRVEVVSGGSDEYHALLARNPVAPGRGTLVGKVALERRTVRIPDVLVDAEYRWHEAQQLGGFRTLIGVPLLKDEAVLGVINLWRREARPFTDHQIELVTSFADQAVIALENTRLFTELEDKGRQLEVASRHKSEFLATMSHELRTPLNAINGFSEVLLERYFGDLNAKQEEYLNDILSSGRHLLSLINDILDLSKVEAGRMELEPSRFPLAPLLESGLVMVRERAGRNGVRLGLDVGPEVGEIEADERKVKQVLFNLLSNAVKFTPPGGRVDVVARSDGEGVEIAVRDTGPGIAEEDQGRIFEAFRQARPGQDHSEGTGLGLALTRRLVELHGGRIGVQSAPGRGSTFTVALPRHPTPAAPAALAASVGQPAGA